MGLQRQWSESRFPEIKIFEICPLCCCSPRYAMYINKIKYTLVSKKMFKSKVMVMEQMEDE